MIRKIPGSKNILNWQKNAGSWPRDDFYVDMPDLMENVDVLASLRGAQEMLYDTIDEPEIVKERVDQITALYYEYFDRFYDIIKDKDGGNAYTVFQIWGTRKDHQAAV